MTTTSSSVPLSSQEKQSQPLDATAWVERCLGKRLLCTMSDGRQAYGILTCIDRLNNLILIDCTERRVISSTDYNDTPHSEETQVVSRSLPQAMIPGHSLIRVEMMPSDFHQVNQSIVRLNE